MHLSINPFFFFSLSVLCGHGDGESKGMNKILILHNFNSSCDLLFLSARCFICKDYSLWWFAS